MIRAPQPEGLSHDVIETIEAAILDKAKAVMTARRFLDFEGPLGSGVSSLQVGPIHERPLGETGAHVSSRAAIPIPTLHATFELPRREVEGAMRGLPLNTDPAEEAAERVALAEEHLLYLGVPELGIAGIVTHEGAPRVTLSDWTKPGGVIGDVIAAADALDRAKVHGPLALALAPTLYNQLFRKYEGSDVLALDHLRRLATAGIYKCHVLEDSAVLVSQDLGPIVCAQDLRVSFLEVREVVLRFIVSSALVLRLDEPRAACVLGPAPK